MKYLDNDTRITATLGGYQTPMLFETREELDEHIAWLKSDRGYPKQKLWDEDPDKFPCLMIVAAEMSNPNGANWIVNTFLYDVEIDENEE